MAPYTNQWMNDGYLYVPRGPNDHHHHHHHWNSTNSTNIQKKEKFISQGWRRRRLLIFIFFFLFAICILMMMINTPFIGVIIQFNSIQFESFSSFKNIATTNLYIRNVCVYINDGCCLLFFDAWILTIIQVRLCFWKRRKKIVKFYICGEWMDIVVFGVGFFILLVLYIVRPIRREHPIDQMVKWYSSLNGMDKCWKQGGLSNRRCRRRRDDHHHHYCYGKKPLKTTN